MITETESETSKQSSAEADIFNQSPIETLTLKQLSTDTDISKLS